MSGDLARSVIPGSEARWLDLLRKAEVGPEGHPKSQSCLAKVGSLSVSVGQEGGLLPATLLRRWFHKRQNRVKLAEAVCSIG